MLSYQMFLWGTRGSLQQAVDAGKTENQIWNLPANISNVKDLPKCQFFSSSYQDEFDRGRVVWNLTQLFISAAFITKNYEYIVVIVHDLISRDFQYILMFFSALIYQWQEILPGDNANFLLQSICTIYHG